MRAQTDPIFMGAFIVSACLHLTLIVGWNNMHLRGWGMDGLTSPAPAIIYAGPSNSEFPADKDLRPSPAADAADRENPPPSLEDYVHATVELPERAEAAARRSHAFDRGKTPAYGSSGAQVRELNRAEPIRRRLPKARVEDIDLSNAEVFRVFSSYYVHLSAHIKQRVLYPLDVEQESKEGLVYVSFVLHRGGQISDLTVVESSGDPRLDRAALSSIRKSVPFPFFPSEIKEDKMTLYLPVSFRLE